MKKTEERKNKRKRKEGVEEKMKKEKLGSKNTN